MFNYILTKQRNLTDLVAEQEAIAKDIVEELTKKYVLLDQDHEKLALAFEKINLKLTVFRESLLLQQVEQKKEIKSHLALIEHSKNRNELRLY